MRPPGCPSSPFLPDLGGGTPRVRQDGDRQFPSPSPSLLVWFILEIQKQEKQKSRVATKAKSKFTFFAFIAPASRRVDATRVAAGWGLHAEAGRTRTCVSDHARAVVRVPSTLAGSDLGPFLSALYDPLAMAAGCLNVRKTVGKPTTVWLWLDSTNSAYSPERTHQNFDSKVKNREVLSSVFPI